MKKIILTMILMHIISGSSASLVMSKHSIGIRRNQMLMTVMAIVISLLQTVFLAFRMDNNE